MTRERLFHIWVEQRHLLNLILSWVHFLKDRFVRSHTILWVNSGCKKDEVHKADLCLQCLPPHQSPQHLCWGQQSTYIHAMCFAMTVAIKITLYISVSILQVVRLSVKLQRQLHLQQWHQILRQRQRLLRQRLRHQRQRQRRLYQRQQRLQQKLIQQRQQSLHQRQQHKMLQQRQQLLHKQLLQQQQLFQQLLTKTTTTTTTTISTSIVYNYNYKYNYN